MKIIYLILLSFIPLNLSAQEIDIIPHLKTIEEGNKDEIISKLPLLKQQNPNDPSVMFLDGILIENSEDAVKIFNHIVSRYPKSRYADAALYRIYSYNFAAGLYKSAEKELEQLRNDYPESPYIKIAERDIPETDEPQVSVSDVNTSKVEQNITTDYNFTIQAGAFSNKKNSAALANEFRAAGYDAEIKEKLVAGTVFDVVYVGKFVTENEAKVFLKRINDKYNLDGRIVSLKNGG